MTLAMARDIRVIIVKLADRLHNMRTIGPLNPEKRRRIAKETLDIYSPIANRLGMYELRSELHELAYRAMYPMRIERIERAVQNVTGNRKKIVAEILESLEGALENTSIKGRVEGREKAANSIYRKMCDQRKSFSDIMDVYAFRIVTESVDDCYRALGLYIIYTSQDPDVLRITLLFPRRTVTRVYTLHYLACMASLSKFRFVHQKWTRWPQEESQHIGFTKQARTTRRQYSARTAGFRVFRDPTTRG